MPEWWTYRLSDFLMFTPATYYRLFELHNAALWPAQLATLALGLVLVALAWRDAARTRVAVAVLLAALWLWVSWAFHWRRYATINLAATWFAAAFLLEALSLLGWGLLRGRREEALPQRDRVGPAIALFGLVLQPLSGPLLGRSWTGVEVFGLAPDPTATVALGLLLMLQAPASLLVIPLVWCVVSWATLWAMEAPDAPVPLTVAVVAVVALGQGGRRGKAGRRDGGDHPEDPSRGRVDQRPR